jgi:hypothetical protein
MGKMYINILHRLDKDAVAADAFEALKYQQEAAHNAGMRTTLLLGVEALTCDICINYAKQQMELYQDEIGLNLHDLTAKGLGEQFGIKDQMVYLMPFDRKVKLLSHVFELFKDRLGEYPKSVTSYILDARTLNWLHEHYPSVKAAITSCFEEGVKMFYGNQNQWYLFSDGGPWGAYFPSKVNSLVAAQDETDYCGIVGLPHLNRDMVMAITSRDDLFSSHPTNIVRAKAYDLENMKIPYMPRFVDQWTQQLEFNDFIYYNVYVNATWLTDATMLDESGAFSKELYTENMAFLGEKVKQGIALDTTMSEFAVWMEKHVKKGNAEANKWKDIVCGSKREMYWYVDPYLRATIDANIGGAICDLRPYAGRLSKDLGNDTPYLQNMNYPFVVSCENRGGVHEGSIHTVKVVINGKEAHIALKRTTIMAGRTESGKHFAKVEPVTVEVGEITVTLESTYTFLGEGEIEIQRKLVSCSDPTAEVIFTEYHCGCWGDTTYPEDMRSLRLIGNSKDSLIEEIKYAYLGREVKFKNAQTVKSIVPPLNVDVILTAKSEGVDGRIGEGWMFRPFYYLELSKKLQEGEVLQTCMKIQQAEF